MVAFVERFSHLPSAIESGRICAVAGQTQREIREWTAGYGGLFPDKPFDPALLNTVCLCTAFSAPWLAGTDLRMTNRVALWSFALDWLIDYVATSAAEVDDLVERCLAVAAGDPPVAGDELTIALADIRDDLARFPAFPELQKSWQHHFELSLRAMAGEWAWKEQQKRPTFDEYLANTDNLAFTFCFVSHWIATGTAVSSSDLDEILAASQDAQRVYRLINDLGTYERDVRWCDLNALMLGPTRADVNQLVGTLSDRFRERLEPLRVKHPETAYYLERQLDFCAGFHEVTEYWGAL